MNNITKLKDWDVVSSRNLNLSSSMCGSFPNIFNSSPLKNGFRFTTASNGLLPKIGNDNDPKTIEYKSPQCTSQELNFKPVSKRKNFEKLEDVPDKKTKFSKSISTHMEKFISSATDLNILKSEKTYSKKAESISHTAYDTLNCNEEKLTENSSSKVTSVVKRNQSSPLKHANGYVDSKHIDNVTNELSTGEEHCLFSDVLFSESDSKLLECSNEVETVDSIIKEQETSDYNNSYLRTRKNLKSHVGGERKTDCGIGTAFRVNKSKVVNTRSKVANKKKVQVHKFKAIARVSPTVRKPEASESPTSPINTSTNSNSSERGRRKVTSPKLSSLCPQSFSNERVKKNSISNSRSVLVPSSSNKHSRRAINFSIPEKKRGGSILDIANELAFNIQSKDGTPKSANSDLEINVLDCPVPKRNSSKKCNLLNDEVNKPEIISSLQSNLSDRLTNLLSNDPSPTTAATEFKSTKKCNMNIYKNKTKSPCLENYSINESTNSDLYHEIVNIFTIQKQDFYNCLAEVDEKLNKPLLKSKTARNGTSLFQRQQSVASPIEPSRKKKAISCDEDLSSSKHLPLSTSPNKLHNPHICTKLKPISLPFLLCDCNNSNSSSNINTDLLSLGVEINNYASTVVSMAKKNPQKLQLLVSDSTFCKKVHNLFLRNDTENNCAAPDRQHLKANSPTSRNEICNSSLSTSCDNTNLEANIQIQSMNCNWESKNDTGNHSGASDFNYKELESVPKQTVADVFQNQNVSFLQNSLKNINFTRNYCINQLMADYVASCDPYELKASVKLFCEDPQTVEVLSKFLSDIETFSVLSSAVKFQYEFPVNFQDLPLLTVIKGYMNCFIFKIFPLNCKAVTSQSVLHFANENMSALEISAVECFFNEAGLLKPTDFISRFTYVAIVVIYKEYHRRKETVSS